MSSPSSRRGLAPHSNKVSSAGFTLIELLLVIGIIAILAAIVIVAINPTKQLGDARDAQRRSDVNTLLNAVWQYAIDNNGSMPCDNAGVCIDATPRQIGSQTVGCDAGCLTTSIGAVACLQPAGLTGTYVVSLPADPRYGSGAKSGYVIQNTNNRVTVTSCRPEQGTGITVTR